MIKSHCFSQLKSGFTLVGAIIAILAVSAGVYALSRMTGIMQVGEKRLDNIVAADQVLALTARVVQEEDFDKTKLQCSQSSSGNGKIPLNEDATWDCRDASGKFNSLIQADATKIFRSKLNQKADADTNGKFCVELTRCEFQMGDSLLDITLSVFYPDPGRPEGIHSKLIKFRKSRW